MYHNTNSGSKSIPNLGCLSLLYQQPFPLITNINKPSKFVLILILSNKDFIIFIWIELVYETMVYAVVLPFYKMRNYIQLTVVRMLFVKK